MTEKIPSTLQERVDYFENLQSEEGRNGIRVPRFEFDPTLKDPADNLRYFFRVYHSQNGRRALPDRSYEYQNVLAANGDQPATVLNSHFRGISLDDVTTRQKHLERYRELKTESDPLKNELQKLVETKGNSQDPTDNRVTLLQFKQKILQYEMDKIVSESGDKQEGLLGRELGGIRGVEAHELLIPPSSLDSTRYESFMFVGHTYFLEEEQQKYNLPQFQGQGPQRFSRYGWRGVTKDEVTHVWFMGTRINPDDSSREEYIEQIRTVLDASMAILMDTE